MKSINRHSTSTRLFSRMVGQPSRMPSYREDGTFKRRCTVSVCTRWRCVPGLGACPVSVRAQCRCVPSVGVCLEVWSRDTTVVRPLVPTRVETLADYWGFRA